MTKNKKTGLAKAILTAGLISLSSILPSNAIAQNQTQKPTLEEKVGMDIEVNIERTIEGENNYFYDFYENSSIENSENDPDIKNIIDKVETGSINSYDAFVNSVSSLDTNQKLSLLSGISNSLYTKGIYNDDLTLSPTLSQEEFFKIFQKYFEGNYEGLGVCRQISTHIEKLANDIGLKAAAVTGISSIGGHAYDLIKTDSGLAIVDSYDLLNTNTKNVEDVLGLYQKLSGGPATFQHLFFEGDKFKYELITKTGKDFLDFIGYDESLGTLEHSLFEHGNSPQKGKVTLETKNYLNSIEVNLLGFFLKYGQLKSVYDSEFNMSIAQVGYKRDFLIPGIIQINPNLSILSGTFKNNEDSALGVGGSLFLSTDLEKLNFSLGLKGNLTNNMTSFANLFSDFSAEAGTYYKIDLNKINITPYLLTHFSNMYDFEKWKAYFDLSEISAGAKFNFSSGDLGLSFNPHYSRKIWEQELGADAKFNYKNFGIKLGGYATQSNYNFCPNKSGLEIQTSVTSDTLGGNVSYKTDLTDYSGETKTDTSFSFNVQIKL